MKNEEKCSKFCWSRSIFAHILTNYKVPINIPFLGYFFVINSNLFVENSELFDETFINAHEDVDLALRMLLNGIRVTRIRYSIGPLVGSSLGNGYDRQLRTISGDIYFFKKEQKSIGGSLCTKE
jgi:GT2 family glycosyltransferase